MSPADMSMQYPKHTLWGMQNHRPVKITYGRRWREPSQLWAPDQSVLAGNSSHGDGTSTSEDENPSRVWPNTQRNDPKNSGITQSNLKKHRRPATELLLLPPFFSQVSIRPGPASDRTTPSDRIEHSIDELNIERRSSKKPPGKSKDMSLTSIRTRLRNVIHEAKTLAQLQMLKRSRNPKFRTRTTFNIDQFGDGFEKSERNLQYQPARTRQYRRVEPKIIYSRCLDLRSGALPPVYFACRGPDLIRSPSDRDGNASENPAATLSEEIPIFPTPPTDPDNHNDEDAENASLERMIIEQLSSISAPPREPSTVSEDGSETSEGSSLRGSGSLSRSSSGFCVDDNVSDASGQSGGSCEEDELIDSWEVWRENVRGF